MQLWYALNPFGDREKIEGRVLYVFLKLVYDPYWDGQQESMNELINATTSFLEDVRVLQEQREFPNDITLDETDYEGNLNNSISQKTKQNRPIPAHEQIDGLWNVEELIQEMYSLADKFTDYKHG